MLAFGMAGFTVVWLDLLRFWAAGQEGGWHYRNNNAEPPFLSRLRFRTGQRYYPFVLFTGHKDITSTFGPQVGPSCNLEQTHGGLKSNLLHMAGDLAPVRKQLIPGLQSLQMDQYQAALTSAGASV